MSGTEHFEVIARQNHLQHIQLQGIVFND